MNISDESTTDPLYSELGRAQREHMEASGFYGGTWHTAVLPPIMQAAEEGPSPVVKCGGEDVTVRSMIPVGHGNVFDREVFPRLTIERRGQGACTFDVSRDYQFTWREKVRFDGKPYSDSGRAPTPREAA